MCAGGKAPLPVGAGPQAELREQKNVEGQVGEHAGSKLEGKAFPPHPPRAGGHLPFLPDPEP